LEPVEQRQTRSRNSPAALRSNLEGLADELLLRLLLLLGLPLGNPPAVAVELCCRQFVVKQADSSGPTLPVPRLIQPDPVPRLP
jgi:hypothetical protein